MARVRPVSPAQEALWLAALGQDSSPVYNLAMMFVVDGPVSEGDLRSACRALFARHPALRTTIRDGCGGLEEELQSMDCVTISELPGAANVAAWDHAALLASSKLFDLRSGLLARCYWSRPTADQSMVLLVGHHAIVDEQSAHILAGSLAELLAQPQLREAVIAGPSVWTARAEAAPAGLEGSGWSAYLGELQKATDPVLLPMHSPLSSIRTTAGGVARVQLRDATLNAIDRMCSGFACSRWELYLSVYLAVLCRYGNNSAAVSVAMSTRGGENSDEVGYFVNALPVPFQLDPTDHFSTLLALTREQLRKVYGLRGASLAEIVREVQPWRAGALNALGQTAATLVRSPDTISHEGVRVSLSMPFIGHAKRPLSFGVREWGEHTEVRFDYLWDVLSDDAGSRISEHFKTTLLGVLDQPERPLVDLPLLPEKELHRVSVTFNKTERILPTSQLPHEMFETCAREAPGHVALRRGAQCITYGELDGAASGLAARLLPLLQARTSSIVGLYLPRSIEMISAILGTWRAGAAYLPLDPEYPSARTAFMARDAQCAAMVTTAALLPQLPPSDAPVLVLDDVPATVGEADERVMVPAEALAYVIYTSGSTGQPKGVMIQHDSVRNLVHAQRAQFLVQPDDRVLHFASPSFDVSVWELVMTLTAGATLVIPVERQSDGLAREMLENKITIATLPPQVWGALHPTQFEDLRVAVTGGDVCPPSLVRNWARGRRLFNNYGPTETTVFSTGQECDLTADGREGALVSIGAPFANTTAFILDAHRQPVPLGIVGELYHGGPMVARGYLGREELTADRFVAFPGNWPKAFHGPGGRLYRTGDLARWREDGRLECIGRRDHQVKLRGFRIELGEVEAALRADAAVRDAVVVCREDTRGQRRLVAYVVPEHGGVSATDVREHLRRILPDYMVPAVVTFLEQLPLGPTGKADREALPDVEIQHVHAAPALAPRTRAESVVAEVCEQVLGLDTVSMTDNFFDLGGDSILAMRIVAGVSRLGLEVSPREVFDAGSLLELAASARDIPTAPPAPVRLSTAEAAGHRLPLTPIQCWFFDLRLKQPWHFNQSRLFEVPGGLDEGRLRAALEWLVEQHDALRLQFSANADGSWEQQVPCEAPSPVLIHVPVGSREELQHVLVEEGDRLQASLDLEQGPLLKALWLDRGPGDPGQLLLVAHHLVIDAVSWSVLLHDLATSYASSGTRHGVAATTTTYAQWASLLVDHARSDLVATEAQLWLKQAAIDVPCLFPVGAAGDPGTFGEAQRHSETLDVDHTRRLLTEVPRVFRAGVTEVLLAALARALLSRARGELLLFDLERHGREDIGGGVDVSGVVGWFTTIVPTLLRIDGTDRADDLRQVVEQLRAVPRKGISYGLARYMHPDEGVRAQLARAPRPQVCVNYLGHVDGALRTGGAGFRPITAYRGEQRAGGDERTHFLDVIAAISDGSLAIDMTLPGGFTNVLPVEVLCGDVIREIEGFVAGSRWHS